MHWNIPIDKLRSTGNTIVGRNLRVTVSLLLLLVVAAAIYLAPRISQAATNPPYVGNSSAPADYSLVWSDEFNGASLDSSKWNTLDHSNYNSGIHDDACYYSANVGVSGGTLNLKAQQQETTCGGTNPDNGTDNYFFTSGFATTRGMGGSQKFSFKQGYIEARIKAPKGNPYWSAFWLVGADGAPAWPQYGEFDILEQYGKNPDSETGTIHYACSGKTQCQSSGYNTYNFLTGGTDPGTLLGPSNFSTYTGSASAEYHRYGLLWTDSAITWYVDGKPVRTFDGTHITQYTTDSSGHITSSQVVATLPAPLPDWQTVLNYYHTIDLNLSVGGSGPRYNGGYTGIEDPDGTQYDFGNYAADNPGYMKIDYVRVYQLGGSSPTPSSNVEAESGVPTYCANQVDDSTASNNEAVKFGACASN